MQVRANVIFVSLVIQLHYLIISTVSSEAAFTNSTSKFHRKCSLMSLTSSSLQTSVSHIFHVHPLSTCRSFVLLCCCVSVEKYKNKQNKASQFFLCPVLCSAAVMCHVCGQWRKHSEGTWPWLGLCSSSPVFALLSASILTLLCVYPPNNFRQGWSVWVMCLSNWRCGGAGGL